MLSFALSQLFQLTHYLSWRSIAFEKVTRPPFEGVREGPFLRLCQCPIQKRIIVSLDLGLRRITAIAFMIGDEREVVLDAVVV